jgi:POT family proton-dependent oligopeptide transporter
VVHAKQQRTAKLGLSIFLGLLVLVAVLGIAGVVNLDPVALGKNMRNVMLGMAVLYFAYLFFGAKLTSDEKKRVAVIVVLFLFAMIFWSAFEQAPTSLNLFAADYTDRVVFGWEMPVLWLQAANSLFVILLAPVFAWLWVAMARRGTDLSSPAKFVLGLVFAALGFLVMVFAANRVIGGGGIRVSAWWLVVSYLFQTIGELSLSPVGLSSMTKLAPRKFAGQMFGVWFMAAALGNLIAGLVGGHVDPEKISEMPILFRQTTISLLVAAVILAALIVPIRKMMATSTDGAKA